MTETNWESYLKSIEETYAQWWTCYTITDVVGKTRQRQPQGNENPPLLMGLTVRTVCENKAESDNPNEPEDKELNEKIEQFPVLEGLRKYAPEQILLIGRPGSGKSTALLRVLLEEARKPPSERLAAVPVLVELRYYRTDFLDLIRDFCKRHGTLLSREEVERLLFERQLFLLVDGLNELPSEAARRDAIAFRQTYPTTPTIFTTRDLGVGGDLNIAKKLTMQPLTEPQMQDFVRGYLGDGRMLAQLGNRLREFGQTPLLLWMLCSVFAENENHIPANLGSVFRCFCELYATQLKQDVPAAEDSPEWWQPMLQQLAWVMTRGESATEIQVAISRQKAEAVLVEFLAEKVAHPADCARRWLKDLLKYHLLQLGAGNQIEFRHQLIQEYYAAESLLQRLPSLGRDELKWEYLNYLKWTEPLALMLELVEEEALAAQVVRWALEIDWELGARLAGAVQPQWQEQTVGLVSELNLPRFYIVELLGITRSDAAIPGLLQALEDSDSDIRRRAASALGKIGSKAAISNLLRALEDSDFDVRKSIVYALGKIGSKTAIPGLLRALKDPNSDVRKSIVCALSEIGSKTAIPGLLQALEDSDFDIRKSIVYALGEMGSDLAVSGLSQTLEDSNLLVRSYAANSLGEINSEAAISELIKVLEDSSFCVRRIAASALSRIGSKAAITGLLQALENSDSSVRGSAAYALIPIGSEATIPGLLQALEDSDSFVRRSAASALSRIRSKAVIPGLLQAVENSDLFVRFCAAEALSSMDSEVAISGLLKALAHSDSSVRWNAAEALGKIGSKATIPRLLQALEDSDLFVRWSTVEALGKIGSEAVIPGLLKALKDSEEDIRRSAVVALKKLNLEETISDFQKTFKKIEPQIRIGSKAAIFHLIQALEDSDSSVRRSAVYTLGKTGSKAAIFHLIQALKDSDFSVRWSVAPALGKIGSEAVIPGLLQALEHSDWNVRQSAASSLVKMGSEAAILGLIQALKHSNWNVRQRAAEALSEIISQKVLFELTQNLKKANFIFTNNGDTFRNAIQTLKTVQEKLKYYQPLPKSTMTNPLSHHYALLIGVGNCEYPKWSLPVTVKDVRAFQSLLTDANLCGYINDTEHLRLLHDSEATGVGILNGLNWLQQQTANDPEATVIIYYSGHGWLDETTNKYYLIPHDVDPFDIANSALPADTFNQALQQIQAQKVLIIIDSCHAQGMATAKDATPLKLPPGFAATALPKTVADTLSQGTGRAVFTSSKGNQKSWIRPDNSLSRISHKKCDRKPRKPDRERI